MFRDSFKYYKSRAPPPDLRNLIDLDNPDFHRVKLTRVSDDFDVQEKRLGLRTPVSWKIFEFVDIPGLVFIRNPFTPLGQRYWITKCLKDYSRKPNKLNLDAHDFIDEQENWWDVCADNGERAKDLIGKLRWATLGYHHNWETKHYSEDSRGMMPIELSEMTETLAKVIGFTKFTAEAAIVNYYRMNSTLAGHADRSEIELEAPLFSISFGQSAIFLVGGLSQEEPANAILLRSGDVVVMSGESRLRYHGIPKILSTDDAPWHLTEQNEESRNHKDVEHWRRAKIFISNARINMNVRQVLKNEQTRL